MIILMIDFFNRCDILLLEISDEWQAPSRRAE
jgi:hypothetical protein